MNNNMAKNIVLMIFSFLLTLSIFFLSFFSVTKATIMNENYALNMMSASGYYENLESEIDEYFISYGNASGFDQTFMTAILDEQKIENDVKTSLDYIYGKSNTQFDKQAFSNYIYNLMCKNADSRGIAVTPSTSDAIRYTSDVCAQIYSDSINLIFTDNLKPLIKMCQTPLLIALMISAIIVLVSALLIYIISEYKHGALRYYIYSMTASTFLLLLVSLLPILSGKIPLLNFINNSMYNLSTAYITTFFIHFLYIAIACMILTIIVSYLYIRLKRSITISKKHYHISLMDNDKIN